MIDVEVQINYLKDTDIFNKEIEVIRKGKKIKVHQKYLEKGDIYKMNLKKYNKLSKKGYVKKINKPEQSKKTSENEGE